MQPVIQPAAVYVSSCRQGAARAAPREAPGSRGHARRDGAHPGRHAAGGADRPGAVEAEAPPLLQREPPTRCFCVSVSAEEQPSLPSTAYNGWHDPIFF